MRFAKSNEKDTNRNTDVETLAATDKDGQVSASSLQGNREALQSSNHTTRLLRAAMPHVGSRSQKSMSAILQVTELIDTFQDLGKNDGVSAMDLEDEKINLEAMLTDMKAVSIGSELEMLDTMLNFVKARNLYNTYRTATVSNQGSRTAGAGTIAKMMGLDDNANMMDMLTSFLTPEQKATFDNLSMIMSVMS